MSVIRLARMVVAALALMPLAAFAPVEMSSRPRQVVVATTAGQVLRKMQPRRQVLKIVYHVTELRYRRLS